MEWRKSLRKVNAKEHGGFTLIELLVVIAIIAILAAILFPVFSQAREKARQVSCLSNIRNAGSAYGMYAQDYDEFVVPCFTYNPWATVGSCPTGEAIWPILWYPDLLDPYVRNAPMWQCPTRSAFTTWRRCWLPPGDGPSRQRLFFSYGCNNTWRTPYWGQVVGETMQRRTGPPTPDVHNLAAFPEPALHFVITDAITFQIFVEGWPGSNVPCPEPYHAECCASNWGVDYRCPLVYHTGFAEYRRGFIASVRHLEGYQALYQDGHAKWVRDRNSRPINWLAINRVGITIER